LPAALEYPKAAAKDNVDVTLTEELLVAAANLVNYRVGTLPDDPVVLLVCRAPHQPLWQLVGRYADIDSACADARRWQRRARALRQQARRLFVIEHLLLRGTRAPSAEEEVDGFDYRLTATAVVCLPGREANDPEYREHVREAIRRTAPAHVFMNTSFLRLRHLEEFEGLRDTWLRALATPRDRGALERACRAMRQFLVPSQS
jgi:hypothetical protein